MSLWLIATVGCSPEEREDPRAATNLEYVITQADAVAFVRSMIDPGVLSGRTEGIGETYTSLDTNGLPKVHVVNYTLDEAPAWVMISGDERITPLLGYGSGRYLPESDVSLPGIRETYEEYGGAVIGMRIGTLESTGPPMDIDDYRPVPCGERYGRDCYTGPGPGKCWAADVDEQFGPLLTTTWGQNCPYNRFGIPNDNGTDRCGLPLTPAGCIPAAMAQIINYWAVTPGYDYGAMLPFYMGTNPTHVTIATQDQNVVPLYSELSGRLGTFHTCGGTGAIPDLVDGVFRRMGYSRGGDKNDYDAVLVERDIRAGRPVIMNARRTRTSDWHVWVIDGFHIRRTECASDVWQHMNWGWDGNGNNWYLVGQWQPVDARGLPFGSNYGAYKKMFTNIMP